MILILARLVSKYFGIDITRAQKYVIVSLGVLALLVAIFAVWKIADWLTPDPTIDQEKIEQINRANEKERKEELRETVEENLETVRTVDNRSLIVEQSVEARDKLIDQKVAEIDRKIMEVKTQQRRDVTSAELECLLTGKCS